MNLEERLGTVIHYYNHLEVAVVDLEQNLKLGDKVYFLGAYTDFGQEIDTMQIEHQWIGEAYAGEQVAIRVWQRVRSGDSMYRVSSLDEYEEGFEDKSFLAG